MFRDRTKLYLSYRRTVPRNTSSNNSGFGFAIDEEERLIESRKSKPRDNVEQNNSVELKALPPSIFDIAKELDASLVDLKAKTHELNSMYKNLLISNSSERQIQQRRIETLNYEMTKRLEQCYVLTKKFDFIRKNYKKLNYNYSDTELLMIENYKKTYAMKIQDATLVFRNLQNNYMKFLNDDEDEEKEQLLHHVDHPNYVANEEESQRIESYSKQILEQNQTQVRVPNTKYLEAREKEISRLAMGILEVSTIFKEMEGMVVEQGTLLDRIDYNLANTVEHLKSSDKELSKAKGYQGRTTKCKLIFLLLLIVFALLLVVLIKPHSSLN